ncbi:MAG TPA: hypothetical protein VFU23_05105 [Gemmatimonadales bacterium]|nr:hypothetical protein [Gemmatimonadales bacterium]
MHQRRQSARPSLIALGIGLMAAGPLHSQAAPATPLTGLWKLNAELSDKLDDKLREAMRPGAYYGPGHGARPGGGGPGGHRRERGTEDREVGSMIQPVLQILIRQTDTAVAISDAGGQMQSFPTDGRKMKEATLSGGELETSARWKDNRLTIERKQDKVGTVKETYSIDPASGKLILQIKLSGSGLLRSLELRRVYDPAVEG